MLMVNNGNRSKHDNCTANDNNTNNDNSNVLHHVVAAAERVDKDLLLDVLR